MTSKEKEPMVAQTFNRVVDRESGRQDIMTCMKRPCTRESRQEPVLSPSLYAVEPSLNGKIIFHPMSTRRFHRFHYLSFHLSYLFHLVSDLGRTRIDTSLVETNRDYKLMIGQFIWEDQYDSRWSRDGAHACFWYNSTMTWKNVIF